MNSLLLLTLCMLGMAAAQDSLWTALAMKRLFDQQAQPTGMDTNSIASKGSASTLPGSSGIMRTSQSRNFYRNPMNWYMMDQMVDMPDMMMWPFLMGGFN
ncbi:uncharacterized protein LOC144621477 isoform X1 [Crassostrea virginica]